MVLTQNNCLIKMTFHQEFKGAYPNIAGLSHSTNFARAEAEVRASKLRHTPPRPLRVRMAVTQAFWQDRLWTSVVLKVRFVRMVG